MATSFSLVTGNTFSNGDSATATKLNNQVNAATFSSATASILIGFDASKNPVDVPYTAFTTTLLAATSATAAQTVLVLGSAATSSTATFCQTANNLSDVTAASARTNLGLGSAAVQNTSAFDAAGTATAAVSSGLASFTGTNNIVTVGPLLVTDQDWNMHFSTDNNAIGFYRDATLKGFISVASAGGVTLVNVSDARLKSPLRTWGLGDNFDKIQVGEYDLLDGGETAHGVYAQDLYKVFPDAVTVGGNDPKTEPWGVDYAKLVIPLIAEVQALRARVAALEVKP